MNTFEYLSVRNYYRDKSPMAPLKSPATIAGQWHQCLECAWVTVNAAADI